MNKRKPIRFETAPQLRPGVRRPWPAGLALAGSMVAAAVALLLVNFAETAMVVRESGLWPF